MKSFPEGLNSRDEWENPVPLSEVKNGIPEAGHHYRNKPCVQVMESKDEKGEAHSLVPMTSLPYCSERKF
jgi:hypothetical protein